MRFNVSMGIQSGDMGCRPDMEEEAKRAVLASAACFS